VRADHYGVFDYKNPSCELNVSLNTGYLGAFPLANSLPAVDPQSAENFSRRNRRKFANVFIFASTYDVIAKQQRRGCFEADTPGIADRCTKRYRGPVYT
jgi:hypothetical protein